MKTIATLVILGLGIIAGALWYQAKDASSPQASDRNIPGATTGPGRSSLLASEPPTARQ
jgi:hypothetical protein